MSDLSQSHHIPSTSHWASTASDQEFSSESDGVRVFTAQWEPGPTEEGSLVGLENSTQTCVKKSGTKSEKPEVVLPQLQWKEVGRGEERGCDVGSKVDEAAFKVCYLPSTVSPSDACQGLSISHPAILHACRAHPLALRLRIDETMPLDIAAAHRTGTSKDVRASRRRWPSAGVASSAGGRGVRLSLERMVEESEMCQWQGDAVRSGSIVIRGERAASRRRRCAYPGKGTRSLEQSGAVGAEDMVAPRAAPLPPLDLSTVAAAKVKHMRLSRAHTPSPGGPRVRAHFHVRRAGSSRFVGSEARAGGIGGKGGRDANNKRQGSRMGLRAGKNGREDETRADIASILLVGGADCPRVEARLLSRPTMRISVRWRREHSAPSHVARTEAGAVVETRGWPDAAWRCGDCCTPAAKRARFQDTAKVMSAKCKDTGGKKGKGVNTGKVAIANKVDKSDVSY
ncbi:hypothetical protein K438DRAFT_1776252 [Mycena galopus ATCC 62051]|nr:hypothetical protein K438DRAFT_1776252 [Mycena galopus ATCC 62051]